MSNAESGLRSLRIEKASIFDMNTIVKMASVYHKEDPIFRGMLSNPAKIFFYKVFGPFYIRLRFESFKAVVSGKIVGYMLLKHQVHSRLSTTIWDVAVDPDFRGKGVGTSLMKTAEKNTQKRYQYITLAVMEDNTTALRLYQKLGYSNLSETCFVIMEIPTRVKVENNVELEPISGKEAVSCRSKHSLAVVEAVSGSDGREAYQSVYLSNKLERGIDRFRIVTSGKEVGYVSLRLKKGLASVFLILHPDFWHTNSEVEVIERIMDHVAKKRKDRTELCVMQGYERSLESTLTEMGYISERIIGRIGLIKKLGT
jgi:GNAT superfamily N-acetyltransferase